MKTYTPKELQDEQLSLWFCDRGQPDLDQTAAIDVLRSLAKEMAHIVFDAAPNGPDQTVAVRKIREAVLMCEEAIMREPLPTHAVVTPASMEPKPQ